MRKLLKFVATVLGTGLTGGIMAVVVGISSLLMQGSQHYFVLSLVDTLV